MLRKVTDLEDYSLMATDGEIGSVHDFYFSDETWWLRYLVADCGGWLEDRKVLLSPTAVIKPEPSDENLRVALSKKQIENSPDIDTERPVSRQHEVELHQHYNWPFYWANVGVPPVGTAAPPPELLEKAGEEGKASAEEEGDPDLRSTREVTGYRIRANDGEIGHVEDLIMDDEVWRIRYMIVDTKNLLPGKKVMLALDWIDDFDWAGAQVHVDLTCDQVKNSPEFEASKTLSREYEKAVYEHFNRPKYWKE